MPNKAEAPKTPSIMKSTPSKLCLMEFFKSPRTILFTSNSPLMADLEPTMAKPKIKGKVKTNAAPIKAVGSVPLLSERLLYPIIVIAPGKGCVN